MDIYRYIMFESMISMINYSILQIYNSHYDPIIHDIYIPLNPIYDPRDTYIPFHTYLTMSMSGSRTAGLTGEATICFPPPQQMGPSWAVQM